MDEFLENYDAWKNRNPSLNISQPGEGDIIEKGRGLSYIIDTMDIPVMKKGQYIDFMTIHEHFNGDVKELFGDRKRIPFSEAYEKGIGECLEKTIAG